MTVNRTEVAPANEFRVRNPDPHTQTHTNATYQPASSKAKLPCLLLIIDRSLFKKLNKY